MPSGAKKRKAAKKKMEKEANNTNSTTHFQGEDDLKTHDEKESDGGEVSSPASEEHLNHSQHPFTEGEEEEVEKREDPSSARSFVAENEKSTELVESNGLNIERVEVEEESIVQIDSNLKPKDGSERENITSEYVESVKESDDGALSKEGGTSSSSSSDDESHVVEKNIVVVEPDDQTEIPYDLVSETDPFVDPIKPVIALSEVETQVIKNVIPVGEANKSVVASILYDKISSPLEVFQAIDIAQVENLEISAVVESRSKEIWGEMECGVKILPVQNESSGDSYIVTELNSEEEEDKVVSTSEKNAAEPSDFLRFEAQKNEDKLLLSRNAPIVTSNDVEHGKEVDIRECSDSQPLVSSVPRTVETTSWMSCCGLFDVLKGSN